MIGIIDRKESFVLWTYLKKNTSSLDFVQPKEEDFSKACVTAIISDLHLCEAQEPDPKYPLWKKYKTREFFFDEEFKNFLQHIQDKANGQKIELILNGDIFDFDSCMAFPENAPYKISMIERRCGLLPQEAKSSYKIRKILEDHEVWVASLRDFILKGHRVVFIIGNHDLELHYQIVQDNIIESLNISPEDRLRVRFCSWFYISHQDTLIEHGNQYDPYCLCQNPISPMVQRLNRTEVRIPFGNLVCRYMINQMGFFNPHADSNFVMTVKEYVSFFFRYMAKAQPFLLVTWFTSSAMILVDSFIYTLLPAMKDPLTIEGRIESIAKNANATPRMVREMKELVVHPAAFNPLLIARELRVDRAFIVLLMFIGIYILFANIKLFFDISFFWMFIPLALFIPFFIFHSRDFQTQVYTYKDPKMKVFQMASKITRVKRIVYGHTHTWMHKFFGKIEHLNCGTWSPAFLDVECTKPFYKKTFVWIEKLKKKDERVAMLYEFKNGTSTRLFGQRKPN